MSIWNVGAAGGAALAVLLAIPGQATADAATAVPSSPVDLSATNTATSISVSWVQPTTGPRPTGFRVYEGSAVVARNTTTHVTIPNLPFNSRHTYTVTAVDAAGRESAPSAPVSRTAIVGGPFACGMTAPSGLAATEITASSVSLSWSNAIPTYDQPGTLQLSMDATVLAQPELDSFRVGGLAAASTHTFQIARVDCLGNAHPGPPLTITTAAGSSRRPAAPTGLTVGARTDTSVGLSWTPVSGADPTARYAVYDGGTRVGTTTATFFTVTGLWRDTAHQFVVLAVDAAGNESPAGTPVAARTLACGPQVPSPVNVQVTPVSPSSVALSWVSLVQAASFEVYRADAGGQPSTVVARVATPSAIVTGLASSSTSTFAVAAVTGACGSSAAGTGVSASTPAGPAARPAAPAALSATSAFGSSPDTGVVTLSWTQPGGADPAVGYRVYEGSGVLATSQATTLTLVLPAGPTHLVTVGAVDAAGNESAQSAPVSFTVPFIPPP